MKKHIAQFFKFLEDKGEQNVPLRVKLLNSKHFEFTKEELIVKGDLDLSETNIKELPQGLQVKGYLHLNDCTSLKELPKGLEVGQNLYLRGCVRLGKLPQGLKVGGHLWIADSGVAENYKKYTGEEVEKMIEDDGGYVKGGISMY